MLDFMNYNFNINKIVLAMYVGTDDGRLVHKNRPNHGLVLNLNGEKIYTFDNNKKLKVKKNSILYLPKNSSYVISTDVPSDCFAINFYIDKNVTFQPFSYNVKNFSIFFDSFKKAEHVWKIKDHGFEMKCKSELYNIIYNLQKESDLSYISKNKSEIIQPALHYIHNNYTLKNISINELAQLCGISETYFRRIFVQTLGTSPIKYIRALKIIRAKELILSGMYPIHEVAELSGFFDNSYFCREFKKSTGISPSEYELQIHDH